jgi:beta-lactamase class D
MTDIYRMNKRFLIVSISSILLINTQICAETKCFIAKEKSQILELVGDCAQPHSPCSTFKIPLALMGYDAGILIDETNPKWDYNVKHESLLPVLVDIWKQEHDPLLWMKNSSIPYSMDITTRLGLEKFKTYVDALNYGNKDIIGDKDKNNGLTNAWLSSSLQISGREQITFLEKLIDNKLPVSDKAHEMTKKILFVEDLPNNWKLFGKTGSGRLQNKDGSRIEDRPVGWFIGWLEKENRNIIFAHYIEDDQKFSTPVGVRAKDSAKDKLLKLINTEKK